MLVTKLKKCGMRHKIGTPRHTVSCERIDWGKEPIVGCRYIQGERVQQMRYDDVIDSRGT